MQKGDPRQPWIPFVIGNPYWTFGMKLVGVRWVVAGLAVRLLWLSPAIGIAFLGMSLVVRAVRFLVAPTPDHIHAVVAQNPVIADEIQTVGLRLGDKHPVERIAMVKRQPGQGHAMRHLNRQPTDGTGVHFSLNA